MASNAVGKMVPIDSVDSGLPQACKVLKMQHLKSTIKQSAVK